MQWRYPLVDTDGVNANYNETTGWGDWSDWYYYIYPDGVAVKRMHLWTDGLRNHEWQESMAIMGPNQHPEQVIATDPALALADINGKTSTYGWIHGPPSGVSFRDQKIQLINYRANYKPFTIADFVSGNVYGGGAVPYSVFPTWNHWPVAQIPSDGRYAIFPDRAAHCSLTHVYMPDYRTDFGDRPFQEKLLLEGMSRLSAGELAPLARSWLRPPACEPVCDCRGPGYDPSQGAFLLSASGPAPSFHIAASPDHPIVNPCFVIRNWNSSELGRLEIDGRAQAVGSEFRQGIVRDPNGRQMLVAWLEYISTDPVTFTLHGATPDPTVNVHRTISWADVPQADSNLFSAVMSAVEWDQVGIEYFFECVEGSGHNSDWQAASVHRDSGLAPNQAVAYRVKARDLYFNETAWSPVQRFTTPPVPTPVVWNMNEGAGATVNANMGKHQGTIRGAAAWVQGVAGAALHLDGKTCVEIDGAEDLHADSTFTWVAWIRTTNGGPILARAGAGGKWERGGKVLFVNQGRLQFDVAWAGTMEAQTPIADGQWHHVAVTVSTIAGGDNVVCFVDGRPAGQGRFDVGEFNESGLPVRIGFCNDDFPPGPSRFLGDIDDLRWFSYALRPEDIRELYGEAHNNGTRLGEPKKAMD